MLAAPALLFACGQEPPPPPAPDLSERLFDISFVHQVEIRVPDELVAQLVPGSDIRVPADFTFDGETLSQVGLRLKEGFGSQRDINQKAGFNVKLDAFVNGQELLGVDKFTLGNSVQDESFLGEMITYELFRRAGVPAPRTALAEVTFNGTLFGLYVIRESIDKEFLRRNFDDPDGNLYEGSFQVDNTDVNGMELDTNEDANDRSDLQAFADAILGTPDADFLATMEDRADLDKFFAFWAVEQATYHWDGYTTVASFNCCSPNNYYVYNDLAQGKFVWLPHGADQALGLQRTDIGELQERVIRPPSDVAVFAARLFDQPGTEERLRQAVLDMLDTAWDVPSLLERADTVGNLVRETGLLGEREETNLELFEIEFATRRQFIEERPAIIRAELGRE
jgi:spore coat protein CotH